MRVKVLKQFLVIILATVAIDWVLGAMCASGVLPLWMFFLANVPFGGIIVWMESSWTGTRYVMLGHTVGDGVSLLIFAGVVLAQGCFYSFLWNLWRKPRYFPEGTTQQSTQPDVRPADAG